MTVAIETRIIPCTNYRPTRIVATTANGQRLTMNKSSAELLAMPSERDDDAHRAVGGLVDACKGCYAVQGNYQRPNVKAPRIENRDDWQRDEWENDMVAALAKDDYFRWLDSGDLYALALAWKVYRVMKRTPWCDHWLPTRMHKFPKFAAVLKAMAELPNVSVRPSSDDIDGTFTKGVHGSCIVPEDAATPKGAKRCLAYENDGKCNGCRACWDKSVPVIAYVAHGRAMSKVIRLKSIPVRIAA